MALKKRLILSCQVSPFGDFSGNDEWYQRMDYWLHITVVTGHQYPKNFDFFFSFSRVDSSNCRCSFWPFLAQKFQFWGLCSRKILQIKDWGSNRTCPPFLLFFWRLKCLCSSPTLLAAVLIGDSSTTFWWKLVSCLCHFIHRLLRKTRKKVLHAIAITGHITQWTKMSWKCLIFNLYDH